MKDKEIKSEKEKRKKFHIENPRLFMLIADIICFLALIVMLFLGGRYIINEIFKSKYDDGKYDTKLEKTLLKMNFPEGYLPYYNLGNAEYKEENYDAAISYYKKALEKNPSHKKERECDIRVNLALAMLKKINWDEMENEKDVQRIIRQLKSARNVLTEEGCSNPDNPNGHNKEAEQLKKDIDDMLDKLQQEQEQQNQDQNDQNQQNNDDSGNNNQFSDREQDLKDKLDQQITDSLQEHNQAEQDHQNQESGAGSGSYGNGDKTW